MEDIQHESKKSLFKWTIFHEKSARVDDKWLCLEPQGPICIFVILRKSTLKILATLKFIIQSYQMFDCLANRYTTCRILSWIWFLFRTWCQSDIFYSMFIKLQDRQNFLLFFLQIGPCGTNFFGKIKQKFSGKQWK